MLKIKEFEVGDMVKASHDDVIHKRDMWSNIDWTSLWVALYHEVHEGTDIIGEIIHIKRRNWLGMKLKNPIYTIYTGKKTDYIFYFDKVESYEDCS